MKKWFLMSLILGAMPLSMMAQNDDMYFVPSKAAVEKARAASASRGTYYIGSNRSIDEYNRQGSYYQALPDSDIIDFAPVQGVYPDSTQDYAITRDLMRYEGYEPNNSFWEGYNAGRRDSWYGYGWTSPWYSSYYYGWYDPFYYPWYGTLYDPWYYGYYSPYYYRYGYYGWGHPYYYGYYGGGGPGYAAYNRSGGTGGSISRHGNTHGHFTGYRGAGGSSSSSVASGSRASTARSRTVSGHTAINRSGHASTTTYSNNSGFSGARSVSSGGGGGSSSSSSGGSFSGGGGGGGSYSGGGGGGGGGGIRSGGRR